jgi:preprotein translocase SecE subunit
MARDRKRAKQRRQRREAAASRAPKAPAPGATPVPDPLEHASAEVDVAEAAARIGLETGSDPLQVGSAGAPPEPLPEAADGIPPELFPDELEEELEPRNRDRGGPAAGARASREGNRVFNFIRACWAELQRVQWPDRRQVAQATGVVIGFVVIAGGYLGLMDAIFSRVMDAIL